MLCASLVLANVSLDARATGTYLVKINPTLNGLDIKIEPVAKTGVLVVKLTNKTQTKVRCDLYYEAGPQKPHRSYNFVDPGKTVQSVFRATRVWMSVDVDVKCKAVSK